MGVLALDEGTWVLFSAVALAVAVVGIHGAVDVGLALFGCLFVLAWA